MHPFMLNIAPNRNNCQLDAMRRITRYTKYWASNSACKCFHISRIVLFYCLDIMQFGAINLSVEYMVVQWFLKQSYPSMC